MQKCTNGFARSSICLIQFGPDVEPPPDLLDIDQLFLFSEEASDFGDESRPGRVAFEQQMVPALERDGARASMEAVEGSAELLQIVRRLYAGGGLSRTLNRGHQQCDQDSDNRYHHQQLNECEATFAHEAVQIGSLVRTVIGAP